MIYKKKSKRLIQGKFVSKLVWSADEIPFFFLFDIERVKHIVIDWEFFSRRESIDKEKNLKN